MYFVKNGVQYCQRASTTLKLVEVTRELRGRSGNTVKITGKDWVACTPAEVRTLTSTAKA